MFKKINIYIDVENNQIVCVTDTLLIGLASSDDVGL